jgi:hypothetical protein
MAIHDQAQASILGLKLSDSQRPSSTIDPLSKLHNQASINNNPTLKSVMTAPYFKFENAANPSVLDPTKIIKYTDNLPK